MTRILALGLLALALVGCGLTTGSLAEIPDELLNCQGAPAWRRGGTQRDAEGRWRFSFTLTGARADAD